MSGVCIEELIADVEAGLGLGMSQLLTRLAAERGLYIHPSPAVSPAPSVSPASPAVVGLGADADADVHRGGGTPSQLRNRRPLSQDQLVELASMLAHRANEPSTTPLVSAEDDSASFGEQPAITTTNDRLEGRNAIGGDVGDAAEGALWVEGATEAERLADACRKLAVSTPSAVAMLRAAVRTSAIATNSAGSDGVSSSVGPPGMHLSTSLIRQIEAIEGSQYDTDLGGGSLHPHPSIGAGSLLNGRQGERHAEEDMSVLSRAVAAVLSRSPFLPPFPEELRTLAELLSRRRRWLAHHIASRDRVVGSSPSPTTTTTTGARPQTSFLVGVGARGGVASALEPPPFAAAEERMLCEWYFWRLLRRVQDGERYRRAATTSSPYWSVSASSSPEGGAATSAAPPVSSSLPSVLLDIPSRSECDALLVTFASDSASGARFDADAAASMEAPWLQYFAQRLGAVWGIEGRHGGNKNDFVRTGSGSADPVKSATAGTLETVAAGYAVLAALEPPALPIARSNGSGGPESSNEHRGPTRTRSQADLRRSLSVAAVTLAAARKRSGVNGSSGCGAGDADASSPISVAPAATFTQGNAPHHKTSNYSASPSASYMRPRSCGGHGARRPDGFDCSGPGPVSAARAQAIAILDDPFGTSARGFEPAARANMVLSSGAVARAAHETHHETQQQKPHSHLAGRRVPLQLAPVPTPLPLPPFYQVRPHGRTTPSLLLACAEDMDAMRCEPTIIVERPSSASCAFDSRHYCHGDDVAHSRALPAPLAAAVAAKRLGPDRSGLPSRRQASGAQVRELLEIERAAVLARSYLRLDAGRIARVRRAASSSSTMTALVNRATTTTATTTTIASLDAAPASEGDLAVAAPSPSSASDASRASALATPVASRGEAAGTPHSAHSGGGSSSGGGGGTCVQRLQQALAAGSTRRGRWVSALLARAAAEAAAAAELAEGGTAEADAMFYAQYYHHHMADGAGRSSERNMTPVGDRDVSSSLTQQGGRPNTTPNTSTTTRNTPTAPPRYRKISLDGEPLPPPAAPGTRTHLPAGSRPPSAALSCASSKRSHSSSSLQCDALVASPAIIAADGGGDGSATCPGVADTRPRRHHSQSRSPFRVRHATPTNTSIATHRSTLGGEKLPQKSLGGAADLQAALRVAAAAALPRSAHLEPPMTGLGLAGGGGAGTGSSNRGYDVTAPMVPDPAVARTAMGIEVKVAAARYGSALRFARKRGSSGDRLTPVWSVGGALAVAAAAPDTVARMLRQRKKVATSPYAEVMH